MPHPYTEYLDTRIWRAIASALSDLQASGEVRVETAPEYVIGFLCRELDAKGVVSGEARIR